MSSCILFASLSWLSLSWHNGSHISDSNIWLNDPIWITYGWHVCVVCVVSDQCLCALLTISRNIFPEINRKQNTGSSLSGKRIDILTHVDLEVKGGGWMWRGILQGFVRIALRCPSMFKAEWLIFICTVTIFKLFWWMFEFHSKGSGTYRYWVKFKRVFIYRWCFVFHSKTFS